MNDTLKTLLERRSIRKYKDTQITDEQLNQILEAGKYAPTGSGSQSPIIVVIQNKNLIHELSILNAKVLGREGTDPFFGAPTLLIVFGDRGGKPTTYLEDGSLVLGNIMNAAYSIGVDSCWVNRARQVFESKAGQEFLKEWGIEGDYVGIGNCSLGYRDCEYPEPKPRKENYVIRV